MTDIVTRLRETGGLDASLHKQAADEIERLHRDYSCICNEMRRMMEERDEARRRYCFAMAEHGEAAEAHQTATEEGWDCFREDR
jgi:predicted TIM-barrel fold metal-dependent hydrolase